MKVTEKDVKYIAALSRLEISDEEMPKFTEQFNQILNYADILEKSIPPVSNRPSVSCPCTMCFGKMCRRKAWPTKMR
jgi:Asp-tRNA(Asn)/Glu-tRNA(Gln) amidotransferase C subunit